MIRKLDELGRVAIPQEYCEKLGIKYNNKIDIIFENNVLILKKAADTCVYCGKEDIIQGLSLYGKHMCKDCCKKLSDIYLSL